MEVLQHSVFQKVLYDSSERSKLKILLL